MDHRRLYPTQETRQWTESEDTGCPRLQMNREGQLRWYKESLILSRDERSSFGEFKDTDRLKDSP